MNKRIKSLCVSKSDSILTVLQAMDSSKRKLLIVTDGDLFASLVSVGDIQRAIIRKCDLNLPISQILREQVKYANPGDNSETIREHMRINRNEFMPVVSSEMKITNVIFWEDIMDENPLRKPIEEINLPVVIMAGGQGTRLKPLTNILPKPLIPLKNKTIIEDIMDQFVLCGCHNFYLSVNYKADLIRYYFESLANPDYTIKFFQESIPLGTVGSLYLIKDEIKTTFFVSNCDIILEQDFSEILRYHREYKNEITLVGAVKKYSIPYGTLTTGKDGLLSGLHEKPQLIFNINTGFYVMEASVLEAIPENRFYNITDLIEQRKSDGKRVGVFPISDGAWVDMGSWRDYMQHLPLG